MLALLITALYCACLFLNEAFYLLNFFTTSHFTT